MRATRHILLLVSVAGIGASLWIAHPVERPTFEGWLFACFSSLAWFLVLLVVWLAVRFDRIAVAVGGLLFLALSELAVHLYVTDPLFLVMKPIYQCLILAFGAVMGYPFKRARHADA
jgi:hypothetical protein